MKTLDELLTQPRAGEQQLILNTAPGTSSTLTVAALRGRALARLGDLQRAGLCEGSELLLPTADLSDFLELFWACILGGLRPMPLAAPTLAANRIKLFDLLERRPEARVALAPGEVAELQATAESPGTEWASRVVWAAGEGAEGAPVERRPEDIAFIQYSSGSTSAPKGVIVRHGQALENLEAIRLGAQLKLSDVTLSWMPLSHDMGLVGFHLAPLYSGSDQVLMPVSSFSRAPLLWLQDASRLGATILSSPNFGYRHVLKALRRRGLPEGVDLSAVRIVMNGAEPIELALAEEFLDALEPVGLRRETMMPVYGLAEATLAVTFSALGATVAGRTIERESTGVGEAVRETSGPGLSVVGCGRPLPGLEVSIADGAGDALPEGHVGHVLMRGAGVTEGYYEEPEATAAARRPGGWLDTGDLGFLGDCELHITGRAKDLVIVDGQNFYPHDLELELQRVLEIDPLRLAVAPVRRFDQPEQAAVFLVHRGDQAAFEATAAAARGHLSKIYGIAVEWIVPVAAIPRTTSGKVQRLALARAFEAGEFDEALAERGVLLPTAGAEVEEHSGSEAEDSVTPPAVDHTPGGLEAELLGLAAEILGDLQFGPQDNLFEQGMSSVDLALIHGLVEQRHPGGLDIRDFFDQPSIRGLAELLSGRLGAAEAAR